MKIQIQMTVTDEVSLQYLQLNANVRGMSKTRLLNKVLRVVLADKLIQSVLDDAWVLPPPAETPLAQARRLALVQLTE